GETLVMREMRWNGGANNKALDLRQERFVGHEASNAPTGLADGLGVGSPLPVRPAAPHFELRRSHFEVLLGSPVSPRDGGELGYRPIMGGLPAFLGRLTVFLCVREPR